MTSEVNPKKVARQHKELEEFFAPGFTLKGKSRPAPPPESTPVAGSAQADDTAAALAQIARQINKCCLCDLNTTRTHGVPGEGNVHAELVFVGEAPGADEDEQGRPFVGRAGQLLDKIIAAMGLTRNDVFICNILKCRPPENRPPKPEEIIKCMPILEKQLDLIKPKVIVALGAHAARTLLKTNEPIGQMRGKFVDYYTSSGFGPIKLMPTFHPSYLLRNYSDENRRLVWEDMQKVMRLLGLEVPKK